MKITEKLLFAVHRGTVGDRPAGITMDGYCLPIACSHVSWEKQDSPVADQGIDSLWGSCSDTEEFFSLLGINHVRSFDSLGNALQEPQGLWVYEVTYDDADTEDTLETPWLEGGELRRPTPEEILPLTEGKAPWGGMVF